jgi:hypothetical protein
MEWKSRSVHLLVPKMNGLTEKKAVTFRRYFARMQRCTNMAAAAPRTAFIVNQILIYCYVLFSLFAHYNRS